MPPTKPFLASTMGGFVLRAGASTRPQNRGKGADTLALKYGSHCLPWGVSHAGTAPQTCRPKTPSPRRSTQQDWEAAQEGGFVVRGQDGDGVWAQAHKLPA